MNDITFLRVISMKSGINSARTRLGLCVFCICLSSCLLLFMFQHVSGFQNSDGSRLYANIFPVMQVCLGPVKLVTENGEVGSHISCEGDYTTGLIKSHEFMDGQIWGKIVDSPSALKQRFSESDPVYIRCCGSKRRFIREGDRFGIFAYPSSTSKLNATKNDLDTDARIVGEIEITSVGLDLVLGIIVHCRTEIHKGYQIAPFS